MKAVIFDLDGVIVSTDDYHFEAWKKMADRLHIPFTKEDNDMYTFDVTQLGKDQ